jgi:succinyl-CoA synthetase beta subunit
MDLFEHQAKELFARHGVAVPRGRVAWSPEEAAAVAGELGGTVAVKAQVQIGGRGKAGGIKLAGDPAEARAHAERIIGMDIRGHTVRRVLAEEASDIAAEYYVAILHDRASKGFLAMASAEGGVDIEEVAATKPEAIVKVPVNPLVGLRSYHVNQLVYGAGFDERARKGAAELLARLYDVFVAADCMLVEVNPLVLTGDGQVVALDGKVSLDDSALARHPDLEALRDTFAADPQEQAAKEKGLNYIKLDGYVGIIGNGAGLVMSTLDVVAQAGGKAANFLDVGGGASAETMTDGLEVILSDAKVRSVLVNIFGGITRGDLVAQGILDALDRLGDKLQVPLVVRLDGTNAEEGRALLASSPSDSVVPAATMLDAARKAVELANAKAGA